MSARTSLVDRIQAIVGDEAHVITVEDNKDVLDRMTVMVKQRTLTRLPEAPRGALRVEFVVAVTHPATDPAVSEPELDDFVPAVLSELSELDWFGWTTAEKVLDGQNLSYDIACYVLAGPKNEGR